MIQVRIDKLVKQFGKVRAVDNVSVTIEPGQLFFLLGPSGCGKTTLLRCIAGFHPPDSGYISFDDQNVTTMPAHRRDAAMVFQNYALWPHMTVADNVAFGLKTRKVASSSRAERVREALEMVHIGELAHRKPNQLSGGQQQRVALARALVVRPGCLLLDEPLSNLDAKLRLEMRSQIRSLCKQNRLTTIYVTHDQKEALSIADKIAIMKDGHVEQVGSPAELYERPLTRFTTEFMGPTNFVDATVQDIQQKYLLVDSVLGQLRVSAPSQSVSAGQQVWLSIRPETIRLGSQAASSPSGHGQQINTFAGRLIERTYLGEVAQYDLAIGDDFHVKAVELNPRLASRSVSESIDCSVDSRDIVVLTS